MKNSFLSRAFPGNQEGTKTLFFPFLQSVVLSTGFCNGIRKKKRAHYLISLAQWERKSPLSFPLICSFWQIGEIFSFLSWSKTTRSRTLFCAERERKKFHFVRIRDPQPFGRLSPLIAPDRGLSKDLDFSRQRENKKGSIVWERIQTAQLFPFISGKEIRIVIWFVFERFFPLKVTYTFYVFFFVLDDFLPLCAEGDEWLDWLFFSGVRERRERAS